MSLWERIDQSERLDDVERYTCVFDQPAEEAFDRITRLVCRLLAVKMSTVTLIDGHRQWFKSRLGIEAAETDRRPAFCSIPVANKEPFVVQDARADPNFEANPFVVGRPFIRFYAGVPIRSDKGVVVGTLCAMHTEPRVMDQQEMDLLLDLGKIVEDEFALRLRASTDGLTGAMSRAAFLAEVDRAIHLARRHRYDLSCIVFDLDEFKNVNDVHGHRVGDDVLRATTDAARAGIRQSDLIGRIGGEEFAIVLPHTSAADAVIIAERIRIAINEKRIEVGAASLRVSASFGIAWLTGDMNDGSALIDKADQAMYAAKRAGRNQTNVWQGASGPAGARRVFKAGQIVFNDGRSSIDCTVRRLSTESASLSVVSDADVPNRFKLTISADGLARACAVAERGNTLVRVTFLDDEADRSRAVHS